MAQPFIQTESWDAHQSQDFWSTRGRAPPWLGWSSCRSSRVYQSLSCLQCCFPRPQAHGQQWLGLERVSDPGCIGCLQLLECQSKYLSRATVKSSLKHLDRAFCWMGRLWEVLSCYPIAGSDNEGLISGGKKVCGFVFIGVLVQISKRHLCFKHPFNAFCEWSQ